MYPDSNDINVRVAFLRIHPICKRTYRRMQRNTNMTDANQLAKTLSFISTALEYDVPLQALQAFLFVARNQGCSQKDVEVKLGMTNASASRNVSIWTERRFDRKPGFGLIQRDFDAHDQRFRVLTLTEAGQKFFEQIKGI